MKRVAQVVGLLLLAGLVQVTLTDLWLPFGAVDLVMVACGLLALRLPFATALLTGAAGGLIQDSLGGGLIGLHAFAKTAVSAILTSLGQFLVVRGELASAIVVGLAAVLEGAIVRLLLSFLGWPDGDGAVWLVGRGIGTAAACLVFLVGVPRVVMVFQRRRTRSRIRLR